MTIDSYKDFLKFVSKISRIADKRWHRPLETIRMQVERHFNRDYSECTGAADLESEPVGKFVSVTIVDYPMLVGDEYRLTTDGQPTRFAAHVVWVEPMIELENGETLDEQEALDGLGLFNPSHVKKSCKNIRKRHNADSYVRNRKADRLADSCKKNPTPFG